MLRFVPVLMLAFFAGQASAQEIRYELGRRVRLMEQTWDKYDQAENRSATSGHLQKAVSAFFSLKTGTVAEELGRTRQKLMNKNWAAEEVLLDSLYVHPAFRMLDQTEKELKVTVKRFYPVDVQWLASTKLYVQYANAKEQVFPVAAVGETFTLKLPADQPGDYPIRWWFQAGAYQSSASQFTFSRVDKLSEQQKSWQESDGKTIEEATRNHLQTILTDLARGESYETDYPAHQLLREIQILQAAKEPVYKAKPGPARQHWLVLPLQKKLLYTRFYIPRSTAEEANTKRPLVVALHGAGGSENMFFDAYGDGCFVKECEKRGWFFVAPRAGLTGPGDVAAGVQELARRYPIDTERIYLVGHSMGCANAFRVAQDSPGVFRGLAGLGGSASVNKPESLATLPIFIGCGTDDFAFRGAKRLAEGLTRQKVQKVTMQEYPNVEHLAIVRVACEDVFRFWEGLKK